MKQKRWKRAMSLFLALSLVVCLFPSALAANGNAAAGAWDGSSVDFTWYDTTSETLIISNPEQWAALAWIVSGSIEGFEDLSNALEIAVTGTIPEATDNFAGRTILLDADLDMGGDAGAWYLPVGGGFYYGNDKSMPLIGSSSKTFNGSVDGQGHKITNINANYTNGSNIAVFGAVATASGFFKNLWIEGEFSGTSCVGGLIGFGRSIGSDVTIENCVCNVAVTGSSFCTTNGAVGVGGLAATMAYSKALVNNCVCFGSVKAHSGVFAGLVGASGEGLRISNSYNMAEVASTNAGTEGAGIANSRSSSAVDIYTNCYYTGAVSVMKNTTNITDIVTGCTPLDDMKDSDLANALNAGGGAWTCVPDVGVIPSVFVSSDEDDIVVTGIEMTGPNKLVYSEGDALDLSGLVVCVKYSDGSRVEITDYTTSPEAGTELTLEDDGLCVEVRYTMDGETLTAQTKAITVTESGEEGPVEKDPVTVTFEGGNYTVLVNGEAVNDTTVPYGGDLEFTLDLAAGSVLDTVMAAGTMSGPCSVWDGTKATTYAGGSGTASDPWRIETAEQLAYLAEQVNTQSQTYQGCCFRLDADLDMGGHEWTPIGQYSCVFQGTLDGNGHVIRNLTSRVPVNYCNALFYELSGATVKNLGLADCNMGDASVTQSYYTASLAYMVKNGSVVEDCWSTGTLESRLQASGLVAMLSNSTMRNCWNGASLYCGYASTTCMGGVVGQVYQGSTVKNCWNMGDVSAEQTGTTASTESRVGGVAGYLYGGSTIENCYNTGSVKYIGTFSISKESSGTLSGVGGVLGAMYGNTYTPITSLRGCWNSGSVYASASRAGGVVGNMASNGNGYLVKCSDCYNTGDVTMIAETGYAGGVSGRVGGYVSLPTLTGGDAILEDCYNAGTVTGSVNMTGGICGMVSLSSVQDCTALEGTASTLFGTLDTTNPPKSVSGNDFMSAEEMRGNDFVHCLHLNGSTDFVVDRYGVNGGFPVLAWQNSLPALYAGEELLELTYDNVTGVYTLADLTGPVVVRVRAYVPAEAARQVTFAVEPASRVTSSLEIRVWNAKGNQLQPVDETGIVFTMNAGETYTYEMTADGYDMLSDALTVTADTYVVNVQMTESVPDYTVKFVKNNGVTITNMMGTDISGAVSVTEGGVLQFMVSGGEALTVLCKELTTETDVWDGTAVDTSWYSASKSDFTLTTAAQLAGLRNLVSSGNDFSGKTVRLGKDMDMTAGSFYTIGYAVASNISTGGYYTYISSTARPFSGTFDGQGHTVTANIVQNIFTNGYKYYNLGLFGYTKDATVENVTFQGSVGSSTSNGRHCAGIVGYALNTTVRNCVNRADITGGSYIAGIVGQAVGKSEIINCLNEGDVSSSSGAAGIVAASTPRIYTSGSDYTVASDGIKITGCRNTGDIEAQLYQTASGGAAGIALSNEIETTVLFLESCSNSGTITANNCAGGMTSGFVTSMNNCYNTGEIQVVRSPSTVTFVGGLSGRTNTSSIVTNCYNTGLVTFKGNGSANHQLFGLTAGNTPNCKNNYWVGDEGERAIETSSTVVYYGDSMFKRITAEELQYLADDLGIDAWRDDSTGINGGGPMLRNAPQPGSLAKLEEDGGVYTLSDVYGDLTIYVTTGEEPFEPVISISKAGETDVAVVTAPENGWAVGENTFTVTGENACVIAVTRDGGENYDCLTAVSNDDGSYSFTADLDENTQISVALKGDVNDDGMVDNLDILQMTAATLQKVALDALENETSNVNNDDVMDNMDVLLMMAASLGKVSLDW